MKKLTLIAAVLLLASMPGRSGALTGGIKAGLNISNFTGKDASPSGASMIQKSGFIAGGYIILPVKKQFSFQPEFLYSETGAIYKFPVGAKAYEEIITLTYIELPLLARYDVKSRGVAKPSILFGPAFGVKMSAKAQTRTLGSTETDNLTGVKTLDPGLVLGCGVDITTGESKVTFELRYTMGLSTFYNHAENNADVRNSAGSLLLGYQS